MKAFLLSLGLVIAFCANAQVTTTTNVIYGYVGDYSTNPQPAVVMTTKLLAPNPKWVNNIRVLVNPISVTTDVSGYYAFTNQQWGLYQLIDPNGPVGLYYVYTNTTGIVPIYTLFTNVPVALPPNPNNTPISLGQVLALLATGVNATNFIYQTNFVYQTNYTTVTNQAYITQTNYPLVSLTNDNVYTVLIPVATNIVNGVTNYIVKIACTNVLAVNGTVQANALYNFTNQGSTFNAYKFNTYNQFSVLDQVTANGWDWLSLNNVLNQQYDTSTVITYDSSGDQTNNGSITATRFNGNGAGLTNLNAGNPNLMSGALTTNITTAILSTRTMYFTNGILIKIQ